MYQQRILTVDSALCCRRCGEGSSSAQQNYFTRIQFGESGCFNSYIYAASPLQWESFSLAQYLHSCGQGYRIIAGGISERHSHGLP